MWALAQPCAPRAGRLFADTPLALLAVLALGAATTWALVELGVLAPHAMHVAGVTAGHGALLATAFAWRSEEHTSELQSRLHLVCRLLLEKKTSQPLLAHDLDQEALRP